MKSAPPAKAVAKAFAKALAKAFAKALAKACAQSLQALAKTSASALAKAVAKAMAKAPAKALALGSPRTCFSRAAHGKITGCLQAPKRCSARDWQELLLKGQGRLGEARK